MNKPQIYFLHDAKNQAVKIGYSANVPRRIASLHTSSAGEFRLLGTIDGSLMLEHHVHAVLANYRIAREWFRYGFAVRYFIATAMSLGVSQAIGEFHSMIERGEMEERKAKAAVKRQQPHFGATLTECYYAFRVFMDLNPRDAVRCGAHAFLIIGGNSYLWKSDSACVHHRFVFPSAIEGRNISLVVPVPSEVVDGMRQTSAADQTRSCGLFRSLDLAGFSRAVEETDSFPENWPTPWAGDPEISPILFEKLCKKYGFSRAESARMAGALKAFDKPLRALRERTQQAFKDVLDRYCAEKDPAKRLAMFA